MNARVLGHLACCAALAAGSACCTPSPSNLTNGFAFIPRNPDPATPACFESQNVALISDTHAHHVYTRGDIYQTRLGQDMSPAAVRAPQSDVYAHVLESYLVDRYTRGVAALVHLGDTVDISCEDEFDTFRDMIKSSHVPYFLAPGNHDGFHFGVDDDPNTQAAWASSCDTSKLMPRNVFLGKYLELLRAEALTPETSDPGVAELAHTFPTIDGSAQSFRYSGKGGPAFLQRAAWHLFTDPGGPHGRWSSYVVQELDLTAPPSQRASCTDKTSRRRLLAILVDTSSYEQRPGLILPWPGGTGVEGQISKEEQGVIQQWVDDARAENARIIVVGHHPSDALEKGSLAFLASIRPLMYASAHDHNGKWIAFGQGDATTLELNIGSMIDPPIDVRTFTLRSVGDTLLVDSPLERFDTNNNLSRAVIDLCAPHGAGTAEPWEGAPGDADFYLTYNQLSLISPQHTAESIMDVVIASRARFALFGHIKSGWPAGLPLAEVVPQVTLDPAGHKVFGPSTRARAATTIDAKEALLKSLSAAMDASVSDPPELKTQFEECQHYWGSQYHETGRRLPPVDDWTVTLPQEKH